MKLLGANVGMSQANIPAPLNYRKFLNVMIIGAIPLTGTFIAGLPLGPKTMTYTLLSFNYVSGLLKLAGLGLGNGQAYTPSNATVEKKQNDIIEAGKIIIFMLMVNGFIYSL